MISFDCRACGKAFIVPNARAGEQTRCSACGAELSVPDPPKKSTVPRKLWILPLAAGVIGVAVWLGLWASRANQPAVLRERLVSELHSHSSRWQRTAWAKCDPRTGDYKLDVSYVGDQQVHTFEVRSLAGQTFIRVDPQPSPPGWLAYAVFTQGEQESFQYSGRDSGEKDQLEDLATELNDALRQAVGS